MDMLETTLNDLRSIRTAFANGVITDSEFQGFVNEIRRMEWLPPLASISDLPDAKRDFLKCGVSAASTTR